jgi:hypothetical protein
LSVFGWPGLLDGLPALAGISSAGTSCGTAGDRTEEHGLEHDNVGTHLMLAGHTFAADSGRGQAAASFRVRSENTRRPAIRE